PTLLRAPLSFPTRRSSDLQGLVAVDVLEPQVGVVRRGVVGGDGLAGALGCAGGARRLLGGHGHPPYGDGARGGAEVTRAAGPWARAAAETLWGPASCESLHK